MTIWKSFHFREINFIKQIQSVLLIRKTFTYEAILSIVISTVAKRSGEIYLKLRHPQPVAIAQTTKINNQIKLITKGKQSHKEQKDFSIPLALQSK